MSDNWISCVPQDPHFIPDLEKQSIAQARLLAIAKHADTVICQTFETIQFIDCGCNLQAIHCPSCNQEIPLDWWQDRMSDDDDNGFQLSRYQTPCCDTAVALNELIYDWPQAFGRFTIEAMNPGIEALDAQQQRELEEILETKLIVVYSRT